MSNKKDRSRSRSPTYHVTKALKDLSLAPESTPEETTRNSDKWCTPVKWQGWVEWKQQGWQNFDTEDTQEKDTWIGWQNFNQNDQRSSTSTSTNTRKWEWNDDRWWMQDGDQWYTKWKWTDKTWTWYSTEEWAVLKQNIHNM